MPALLFCQRCHRRRRGHRSAHQGRQRKLRAALRETNARPLPAKHGGHRGSIMIGCYDFCGHYEWTFERLRQLGGDELVKAYWDEAIHRDSQIHASKLIREQGIEGMKQYWGVTLEDEG